MNEVFKDLVVIDASSVLAGPSVGMFFAELGAKVIKIENAKQGGDVTRTWKNSAEQKDATISAYWSSINYKKEYLFLDLSEPKDQESIHELLSTADILLTNFKLGDAKKFNLQPEILWAKYPQLIQASIGGFSSEPSRVAYDVVMQAETGFMYMNGDAKTMPTKMPVALIDVLAAHHLKEAILIALYKRQKTHKGSILHCTLECAGISSLSNQASNYLMTGLVAQRNGSLHPNIAPYGELLQTADGKFIVLAVGSDRQFESLLEVLDLESLKNDERFIHNQNRVMHRTELLQLLTSHSIKINSDHLMEKLNAAFVPAGMVKTMDEIFATPLGKSMTRLEQIEGIETARVTSIAFDDLTPLA